MENVQDMEFNFDKFKEVLHYIISKTDSSRFSNVGKKVLYKLLYFNDFNYYELTELKMTGETYYKLRQGPGPSHFDQAIAALKQDGAIIEKSGDYFGYSQTRYESLKAPVITHINVQELQQIDDTLNRYSSMNGSQISALSHKDTPWVVESENSPLDYDMVFYRSAEMSVRP